MTTLLFRNHFFLTLFMLIMTVKGVIGAISPILAGTGLLVTIAGLLLDRPALALAGMLAALPALGYIRLVTRPHAGFARVFGSDWAARIPGRLQRRMLPRRFAPGWVPTLPCRFQRDLTVGTHPESGEALLADLWLPGAGMPPTGLGIIYLHGSAFHFLDKDFMTRPFFRHLAGQGHAVLDLAYTLAPKARVIPMIHDVKRAISWMKAHADQYGIDRSRIVLMGGSAGGYLALMAAYTAHLSRFTPDDVTGDLTARAVVAYYPAVDLCDFDHAAIERRRAHRRPPAPWAVDLNRRVSLFYQHHGLLPDGAQLMPSMDWFESLMGCSFSENPDFYRLCSPIRHAGPHCPPTLLLQGQDDSFGVASGTRRLHRRLLATGGRSILVAFPLTEHAFDLVLPTLSPAAQAATYDVERFLALIR